MKHLRFAMFGTGFWSRYQLHGWKELAGVECVALYNRTPQKAHELAHRLGLKAAVYDNPRELLTNEHVDFIDIVSSGETHSDLVHLGAEYGVPVICQKPMASSYLEGEAMVRVCSERNVPFFIHENWRWQTPIRKLKQLLDSGVIGEPYRVRIRMASGFPVFDNQPFLKELEQFLLVDIGTHVLDVVRFCFGEPQSLYCCTTRVRGDIRGEDVATVVLRFANGALVTCEMGYAGTPLEQDCFPQTFFFAEGSKGSLELNLHYQIRVTTSAGTEAIVAAPPSYEWADPMYQVVHSSIVPCNADLLAGLRGEKMPETTGEDNLRTLRLVYLAYESASRNEVIAI